MNDNLIINTDTSNSQVNNLPKWYTRLSAFLLDSIIFFIGYIPFVLILGLFFPRDSMASNQLASLISGVLFSIYIAYFHSKDGATLGMKFVGIRISKINEELLTFQNSLIRGMLVIVVPSLLSLIPIIGGIISFVYVIALIVIILTDKNNQGFHDKQFDAIYSVVEEKKTRAKFVVGCYCGCMTTLILLILMGILFGIGIMGSLLNNNPVNSFMMKDTFMKNKKINQENDEKNMIQYREEKKKDKETKSKESDFYKSCVSANTNPNIEIGEYCECAEKEYEKGKDLSEMVNACKDLINVELE